jgi:ribonuclease R
MLAANEAVARRLETAAIPSLYRIHERPEGKRVLEFEQIAAHFGYSLGVGALPVKRHAIVEKRRDGRKVRKDLFMASESFDISSRHYQKLIAKIAGKPEERILTYLMLRSLKQARYSVLNEGHFALAAPSYTHFTSPIRRYPDLIVHRILSRQFDSPGELLDFQTLKEIGEDTSFTERRAAEAERELVEWKKVKFMQDRIGEEFDALIISTAKFGFFVELADLFVEGLVPIETLPDDRYLYHENDRKIIGEHNRRAYAIGDKVKVFLDRADPVERKLQFGVIDELAHARRKRKNKYPKEKD